MGGMYTGLTTKNTSETTTGKSSLKKLLHDKRSAFPDQSSHKLIKQPHTNTPLHSITSLGNDKEFTMSTFSQERDT